MQNVRLRRLRLKLILNKKLFQPGILIQEIKNIFLKKTTWFKMDCVDDSKMKPQKKEKIEKVEWMNNSTIKRNFTKLLQNIKSCYD